MPYPSKSAFCLILLKNHKKGKLTNASMFYINNSMCKFCLAKKKTHKFESVNLIENFSHYILIELIVDFLDPGKLKFTVGFLKNCTLQIYICLNIHFWIFIQFEELLLFTFSLQKWCLKLSSVELPMIRVHMVLPQPCIEIYLKEMKSTLIKCTLKALSC